MMNLDEVGAKIAGAFAGARQMRDRGELTVEAAPGDIAALAKFLRDDCEFKILVDICGNDWPQRAHRFDVIYHFLSLTNNLRIRVKLPVDEDGAVPSIVSLYPAARWFEREAFDMYGIAFAGHADLRRLLTDYGFSGFPLRKDFPLTGYVELRYDDELKRVVYQPVQLVQEFRDFDFMSPWEGAPHSQPGDATPAQAPRVGSGNPGIPPQGVPEKKS
jgi:NADH-quinone oxidoreductase subunit C